jgi:hypothetical protein
MSEPSPPPPPKPLRRFYPQKNIYTSIVAIFGIILLVTLVVLTKQRQVKQFEEKQKQQIAPVKMGQPPDKIFT